MAAARRRLGEVADDRVQLVLMLALTFGTGLVDAVGYLGLDKVFVGNMTGNVVILGMGLGGGADLPVVGPAVALAGFVVGAAVGGRALRGVDDPWRRRVPHLLVVVGLVVLAAGLVVLLAPVGTPADVPGLVVGVGGSLGAAMGLQAATARRVAVADVTTVVVTSTLTGLAADSALGSGEAGRSGRRLLAVALLLLGALSGALLLRWAPAGVATGLLVESGLVLAVAVVALLHARAGR